MSDHKNLLKHSSNYLIANVATKALAFISIPVFTRLLSVEEYGVLNVYISIIMVAPILLTLNTEVAISRYFYDKKDIDDFKEFVGCSINLVFVVFLLMSTISLTLLPIISEKLSLSYMMAVSLIPVSLYKITNSVFCQIYNPIMESKKIAIVSSVQAYLAFILSVIAMYLLPSEKYYGYIIGNILAMFLLGIYLYLQIKPYYIMSFKKRHISYLLNYSIPYLPYSLSGIIILQFGKLIMSDSSGFESAGLYSFASNISLLLLVFIGLVHQAWNPYYFRYMNNNDYSSIDEDYDLIWRFTLILALGLSLFSYEIGFVIGKPEYIASTKLIPFMAVGYVLYQWASVYMRNAGYKKQTIWLGMAVVISGIVNVVASIYLVPWYHDYGAAMAFVLSYFIMLLLTYTINKFILNIYAPSVMKFCIPLGICIPFFVISIFFIYSYLVFNLFVLFLKFLVFGCMTMCVCYKYRIKIFKFGDIILAFLKR